MAAAHPSQQALNNPLGKNVSCTISAEFFKCSKIPFSSEVPEKLKILVLFLSIFYFNEFLPPRTCLCILLCHARVLKRDIEKIQTGFLEKVKHPE